MEKATNQTTATLQWAPTDTPATNIIILFHIPQCPIPDLEITVCVHTIHHTLLPIRKRILSRNRTPQLISRTASIPKVVCSTNGMMALERRLRSLSTGSAKSYSSRTCWKDPMNAFPHP